VTVDGLAAVAVSWIHGCAVQAMIDPGHFDTDEYLAAVRAASPRAGGRMTPRPRRGAKAEPT